MLLQSFHGVLRQDPGPSRSKQNQNSRIKFSDVSLFGTKNTQDCSFRLLKRALGEKEGGKQTVTETPWG
jgi:hypothetical protein